MKAKCKLVLGYGDNEEAIQIERALRPDNEFFVKTCVRENIVEATIEANSVPSLLHTMDDFLSCLSVAEKIHRFFR